MAIMRDPVDQPSNGGGAGAGGNGVGVGSGAEGQRGYGTGNTTAGRRNTDAIGYGTRGGLANAVGAKDNDPLPGDGSGGGGPLVTSPFVPTPVQGNFFNLSDPRFGGGGMGMGRSPFMPTTNLLRMLEQMRMQQMQQLYYQPFLSAFGRRF